MSVLDELERLSSAEEFFQYLGVPFDPAVVHVARLHILRRMGQYLRGSELDGATSDLPDGEIRALCRGHLEQAYQDFLASSPIQERIFKVHKDAIAEREKPAKPMVKLTNLSAP